MCTIQPKTTTTPGTVLISIFSAWVQIPSKKSELTKPDPKLFHGTFQFNSQLTPQTTEPVKCRGVRSSSVNVPILTMLGVNLISHSIWARRPISPSLFQSETGMVMARFSKGRFWFIEFRCGERLCEQEWITEESVFREFQCLWGARPKEEAILYILSTNGTLTWNNHESCLEPKTINPLLLQIHFF